MGNMGEGSSIHQLAITQDPGEIREEEVKEIKNSNMTNIDKDLNVKQSLPKMKKFAKKVTWSNQLTSVKIMTPPVSDIAQNGKKSKLFTFCEEEEDRYLKQLNLL